MYLKLNPTQIKIIQTALKLCVKNDDLVYTEIFENTLKYIDKQVLQQKDQNIKFDLTRQNASVLKEIMQIFEILISNIPCTEESKKNYYDTLNKITEQIENV